MVITQAQNLTCSPKDGLILKLISSWIKDKLQGHGKAVGLYGALGHCIVPLGDLNH